MVATDPETGETSVQDVAATIIGKGAKNLVEVTIDIDGDGGSDTAKVEATDGHPFWIPELDDWVNATELRVGEGLRTESGGTVRVVGVRRWSRQATVHNLTVAGTHTYYVVSATVPVLVHNDDQPTHACQINTPASDELLDYADEKQGQTNVVAEEFSADGASEVGMSVNRSLEDLTPNVRLATQLTGHHRGCGEIGALCKLEAGGHRIGGSKTQAVDVEGGSQEYGWERHGVHRDMCESCKPLFTFLQTFDG